MFKTLSLTAMLMLGVSTAALAEEPRSGGVLNFVAPYGSSFATLDIHATPQTQDEFYAKAIHRSLYSWDSLKNEPVLELATSVSVSDDGKVYTYKLRDNAFFHNGRKMTADDIIWSYKRLATPSNAFPGARYIADIEGADAFASGKATEISGLKKIDDLTLEITFTAPINPGFNLMRTNAAIYPADIGDKAATHPIGLGPFKFVEHVPGSRIVVEKFDKFYEQGKPYLDKINIVIMEDSAARDVAFRNQEIDVTVLGPTQYVAYQGDAALSKNILEVAEGYTRNVGFNPNFAPFADKRVRQAINYAIDTKLIVERLAKNKAYRAVSWLPLSSPAYDTTAQPYAYDPEKAKALLAEAGFDKGFEFELTATQNESWGLPIVEAIIPMLAKVGVTVKAKPVEASVLSEVVPAGDFQAYMWSNESGPDALAALQCFYSKTAQSACNYSNYKNPEFDKLFEAAQTERDQTAKTELLKKANNFLQEEAPVWFFNYNKAVMAYQPWLHGLKPNATELAIQDYEDLWIDETAPASRK